MVRILGFHCHGLGSILGQRTEIPQAVSMAENKKEVHDWQCLIVVTTSKDIGAAGL